VHDTVWVQLLQDIPCGAMLAELMHGTLEHSWAANTSLGRAHTAGTPLPEPGAALVRLGGNAGDRRLDPNKPPVW